MFKMVNYILPFALEEIRKVACKKQDMNFLTWVLQITYSVCMLILIGAISLIFVNVKKMKNLKTEEREEKEEIILFITN